MIAASEPLEFYPRGRHAVNCHPGPPESVVKQHQTKTAAGSHRKPSKSAATVGGGEGCATGANESQLMHRMESFNISFDEPPSPPKYQEQWLVEEICDTTNAGNDWMAEMCVNSENELYFKGFTAVWVKGMGTEEAVLPLTSFTCDSPIEHAFFCRPEFVREKELDKTSNNTASKVPTTSPSKQKSTSKSPQKKSTLTDSDSDDLKKSTLEEIPGICLIDAKSLHVYLSSGEHFLTSLEFAVSQVWTTRYGILLEKTASSAKLSNNHSVAMPRLFSLSHPLDEMCPVLVRPLIGALGYLTDADYRVVHASAQSELVLMYDNKLSKHFVSRLRRATAEETTAICANDTVQTDMLGNNTSMPNASLLNLLGNNSTKQNITQQNTFSSKPGASFNRTQSPFTAKNFNLSSAHHQPMSTNVSGAAPSNRAVLGSGGAMQTGYTHRSFMNSPRDRLHTTYGSGTLAAGSVRNVRNAAISALGHADFRGECAGGMGMDQAATLAKPIAPELCLEHLWIDNGTNKEFSEVASHCFLHCDLVGQNFLCYMLSRIGKLQMLRLDGLKAVHKNGLVASIPARDAVALQQMNLMAVLDLGGTLLLYSGCVPIGKVHVGGVLASTMATNMSTSFGTPSAFPRRSSLLPTSNADAKFVDEELHTLSPVQPAVPPTSRKSGFCISLRDPAGNRLTLVYPGGRMYRCAMPLIAECPFVGRCLRALRAVLPSQLGLQLLVKWYGARNAPGTKDLNTVQEWTMFCAVLTELIGRPVSVSTQQQHQPSAQSQQVQQEPPLKLPSKQLPMQQEQQQTQKEKQSQQDQPKDKPPKKSEPEEMSNDEPMDETEPDDYNENDHDESSSSDVEPKKRRKSENCEGTDADWEYLLAYCERTANGPVPLTLRKSDAPATVSRYNANAPLFGKLPLIFYALHLFYEEQKLFVLTSPVHMRLLGQLLYQLAVDLQLECYSMHYFLDQPRLVYLPSGGALTEAETRLLGHQSLLCGAVPSIFKYLHAIVSDESPSGRPQYPHMADVNNRSRDIVLITNLIHTASTGGVESIRSGSRASVVREDAVEADGDLERFNDGRVSLNRRVVDAILEMRITRADIEQLPLALQILFVDFLEGCRIDGECDRNTPEVCELLLRPDLLEHTRFEQTTENAKLGKPGRTFRNVQREHSLSPRLPAQPDVIPRTDVTLGDDGMEQMDTKLLQLRFPEDLRIAEVRRLLASAAPVPIDIVQQMGVSDHDFIEEQERQLFALCKRTMALPVGRAMFSMRTCTPIATESLQIPKLCLSGRETIKGAAVELQNVEMLPANMNQWPLYHNGVAAGLQITAESRDVDSTWIVYNKPKVAPEGSAEHGGFLAALGLNGHLRSLSFMSTYEYLIKCEEMTSIGLLLGIAAAHCGTQDVTTTKLLSVHLEALLPATALELDIPQNIQVAAIMGIGMVYRGTAKRHMAEVLLQEIGRPPGPEMENCVERESYALTAGLALGLVTLGQGESPAGLRDLQLPDTLHYYMVGGKRRPLCGAQREKYKLPSFQVREGDTVNIDVTAPGSILALGLMFFGTGNSAVAEWMAPPETSYLLDLVRPDLLMLRAIARGLIMWQEIRGDDDWLRAQFPDALRFNATTGPDDADDMSVDHEANCQAYCNILAGAAFCIGLKYAGTEDSVIYEKLRRILDTFLNVNGKYILYAGKAAIESCLLIVLISLSLVFAGSGNLEILRICRMLGARLAAGPYQCVTYGSHMAVHMAIGFLFLGAGRFTLQRTPEAIAALVCALFPKFPVHSNDNRYHLQAFRHLYVLAVEPRILMPRDIDSGKLSLCNLTYVKLDSLNTPITLMAPCMLPELHTLHSVEISDPTYWPVRFQRGHNWNILEKILAKTGCVDIKQKAGCLSHLDDPDRLKSMYAQTLTAEQYSCWTIEPKTLVSFSNDARVQNFMRLFLEPHQPPTEPAVSAEELEVQQLIMLQFYNCLTQDRMHALPIYMNLLHMLRRNVGAPATAADIWQLKIIGSLLHRQRNGTGDVLLSDEIIGSLLKRFDVHMDAALRAYGSQLHRLLFATSGLAALAQCDSAPRLADVAALLTFYELPLNALAALPQLQQLPKPVNFLRLLLELSPLQLSTETVRCIAQCLEM